MMIKIVMKNIYYKVAHRSQKEIDTFKTRYDVFQKELIPEIFKDTLSLTSTKYEQSNSWGTSHVIYFVKIKEKQHPLVLRTNVGFGYPETVMLTEKLITDKVLKLKVPTNKVLYVDVSREKYHFDFQIQEKLAGEDLENNFRGAEEEYDEL